MKQINRLSKHRLIIFIGTLLCFGLHATTSTIQQTQNKLNGLNAQIINLQQTLNTAQNKRDVLNQELSKTEKQISQGIQELHLIQKTMNEKMIKITALKNQVNTLAQQLNIQQQSLANHIRTRYQMGEYQPLKWILNQNNLHQINRILTYYQYLIKSRQQLIDHISTTRHNLNHSTEILNKELAVHQELKKKLTKNQHQLEHNKNYHTALIKSLNNEIQSKQNKLKEAQKNKSNLAYLLKNLSQNPMTQPSKPFGRMRNKLPFPVHTQNKSFSKMNQGVTFFADEGTVVTAVYPGKVVFSDWLKGYGLLLIIDHGHGFMTLYAHNESLFKRKGEHVNQNEQIATVGHSGGIKQNGLYFEIRLRGKAIPPLAWLS